MIEEAKLKYQELAAIKRAELESAIDAGQVQEPISMTAILISIAVSASVSTASYLISRAFAPKPQRQQIGKLSGSIQLQNSEQGLFIPEIYGAGPTASIVAGSSPTWQNLTNTTGGAGGALTKTSGANNNYNAGASYNVAVSAGDAFIRVIRGTGHAAFGFFNTASPTGSGTQATGLIFGVAWEPGDGGLYPIINGVGPASGNAIGHTVVGDEFTVEIRSGRFYLYQGSAEITDFSAPYPTPSYPLYMGVIMYTSGAGVSASKVQIGSIGDAPNEGKGGIKVPAIIVWSSGIRKTVSVTQQPTGGGKGGGGGGGQAVENITYDIDLGLEFCRGPVNLLREYANADVLIDQTPTSALVSGVYDPGTGADTTYDPAAPPDPSVNYTLSIDRVNSDIAFDGDDVGTGVVQGGGAPFAVYPGNDTQQPDPTIEADVDGRYGTGSTTAYRGHSLIVHTNFQLSRWGGIVPNITAVWEHQTLKTLDTIFASFCERVNVLTANDDYDFTGLSSIASRGMLIAGRLFAPAEVIGSPEIQTVYNYFVTEAEGQIVGFVEGDEPSITIADTEIGWMDSDADVSDILPEVDTIIASEISLPRQVDIKYISPDDDWDVSTQSDNRQITEGVSTEVLEVQLALLASEARAAAQRKLYQGYVAGSAHKFTLSWKYLYLYPGYKITITRAEGFSHVMKLTSITGGIGVLDCEGIALEPAAFTQPANSDRPIGWVPPQSIPAMTVLQLLDTPILRDGDVTTNDGIGRYVTGMPRTGVNQNWQGFALYVQRRTEWEFIGDSNLPGTVGVIVSVSDLYLDPDVTDIVFTAIAATDVITSVGHLLASGDEVTVGNTGGALPAPLVAGTAYFVRDVTTDTFKLAATSGGTAINLTTDGTGTNFVNVGKIVVDLYGITASLTSVTKVDMAAGKNLAVGGEMVFNFATATQVADFPNRWALSVLLTGQRDTDDKIASVAAGNRFVLVNEAVKFVPMLVSDVDQNYDYRAVTVGQSLGDAATVSNVWGGNSLRPFKVDSVELSKDASNDWLTQFEGNPRPFEEPETYAVEIWPTTARIDTATVKRILPVTAGTSHAGVLYALTSPFTSSASGKKSPHDKKNNFYGFGKGATIEWITQTNVRVDFGMHWGGADGAVTSDPCAVWLYRARSLTNPLPLLNNVIGIRGVPVLGVAWSPGTIPGTVKETFYKGIDDPGDGFTVGGNTPEVILERDNVDPGFGAIHIADTDPPDAGRPGPRYSFMLSGTEFRIYRNYQAVMAQAPICVIPSPAGSGSVGMGFPLGIVVAPEANFIIRNVIIGGAATLSTVYSKREQILDFGSAQNTVHMRIYQVAKFSTVTKGLPVDVDATIV